ncbi:MAG: hypothetical protein QXQ66_09230 [Candidatus Hadarchaeum sp.]|uniref:hypothetical protein n=1 Tax=Candidatus Hadarchaeum sp. TaxID=2883567 RepID=UPI0031810FA4
MAVAEDQSCQFYTLLNDPQSLFSGGYWRFIDTVVFLKGLQLFLLRRKKRPDFPYPDTKFNPNTGVDLPSAAYRYLVGWFLGRGAEAFAKHLEVLSELIEEPMLYREVSEMCHTFVESCSDAIIKTLERNAGRIPFFVDKESFAAVDCNGNPVDVDPTVSEPADLFAAKGLLASGDSRKIAIGKQLVRAFIKAGYDGRYLSEGSVEGRRKESASWVMLALSCVPWLLRQSTSKEEYVEIANLTAALLKHVLTYHYDPETGVFFEFLDRDSGCRLPVVLPGHVSEVVGFALQAIEAVEHYVVEIPVHVKKEFDFAKSLFPRLFKKAFDLGYNIKYGGMFQAVDGITREVINTQMPWWNLPETFRAAMRMNFVLNDKNEKERVLKIALRVSNDYFINYLNPRLMFFPFRTRDGSNGRVVDIMPVVPEADPLYHTNLAFLDIKELMQKRKGALGIEE